MNGDVVVTDDVPSAFALLVYEAYENRRDANSFSIALSGGSTARPCYERLAKEAIDWSCVTAIWGDERCVPLDHPDSNFLLAKEALFDQVTPLDAVHPMRCDEGAEPYERTVAGLLPIDVVHLGMGDDGHTASLFPGSPALDAPHERLVVETGDDFHAHPRMTLTFAALAASELAVFTVVGANKREMFERVRQGDGLPAGRVAAKRVVWLVDPGAAGQ